MTFSIRVPSERMPCYFNIQNWLRVTCSRTNVQVPSSVALNAQQFPSTTFYPAASQWPTLLQRTWRSHLQNMNVSETPVLLMYPWTEIQKENLSFWKSTCITILLGCILSTASVISFWFEVATWMIMLWQFFSTLQIWTTQQMSSLFHSPMVKVQFLNILLMLQVTQLG